MLLLDRPELNRVKCIVDTLAESDLFTAVVTGARLYKI